MRVFIDQWGDRVIAATVKELQRKAGGGRVSRMFRDKKDGRIVRCGYVVGSRWFNEFQPVEVEVKL